MSALQEARRAAARRTEARFSRMELHDALWHLLELEVEPALQLARGEDDELSSRSPVLEPLLKRPAVQEAWAGVLAVASDVRVYPSPEDSAALVFAFGGLLDSAQLEAGRLAAERLLAVLREALAEAQRARSMVAAGYRDPAQDPSKRAESVRAFDDAGRQALVDHQRELAAKVRRDVARRIGIAAVIAAATAAFIAIRFAIG